MRDPKDQASLSDWLAVAGAILGAFTAILDIQITNSSLANIEGAIGASAEQGSWISTAYLMAEIIVIPLTGWLGSIFGLRRYLAVNTGLFVGFSIACALSTSLTQLIDRADGARSKRSRRQHDRLAYRRSGGTCCLDARDYHSLVPARSCMRTRDNAVYSEFCAFRGEKIVGPDRGWTNAGERLRVGGRCRPQ